MSNSEMRIFPAEQDRTRVCGEAYYTYAAAGNPRRTQFSGKMAIYGWTIVSPVVATLGLCNLLDRNEILLVCNSYKEFKQ